jgi:hypothetical protein
MYLKNSDTHTYPSSSASNGLPRLWTPPYGVMSYMRTKIHELFAVLNEHTNEAVRQESLAEALSASAMLGSVFVARLLSSAL